MFSSIRVELIISYELLITRGGIIGSSDNQFPADVVFFVIAHSGGIQEIGEEEKTEDKEHDE
jgi:hypothetical protein